MSQSNHRILSKMLDRLYASMLNGPSLNARPHASRQRIDLTQLAAFGDLSPEQVLKEVLGPSHRVIVSGRGPSRTRASSRRQQVLEAVAVTEPGIGSNGHEGADGSTSSQPRPQRQSLDQSAVFAKLRTIVEDARTYELDTGVHVLNIGFPLLSLPPGTISGRGGATTRRILAPIAFISVNLVLKQGAAPSLELTAREKGIDLVQPNQSLLAWLEQQNGTVSKDLFDDQEGTHPWQEISKLTEYVAGVLRCDAPDWLQGRFVVKPTPAEAPSTPDSAASPGSAEDVEPKSAPSISPAPRSAPADGPNLSLKPAPHPDDEEESGAAIVSGAVLGLFPIANQGLLRDMQALVAGESVSGPIQSFLEHGLSLERPADKSGQATAQQAASAPLEPASDRFITSADPCQARAARLAREGTALVIHGPPGTGKSQTITNIISDHLARSKRVLLVCDKRTALDVVVNRLRHMKLASLCAVVHDPRRDQRELYRSLRQQMEDLPEAPTAPSAAGELAKVDEQLQALHTGLTAYHRALSTAPDGQGQSLHDLVGQWLSLTSLKESDGPRAAEKSAPSDAPPSDPPPLLLVRSQSHEITSILDRAMEMGPGDNPWYFAAGGTVAELLSRPMDEVRSATSEAAAAATDADAAASRKIPPFADNLDLVQQGHAREKIAGPLDELILEADPLVLARWAKEAPKVLEGAWDRLKGIDASIQKLKGAAIDDELLLVVRQRRLVGKMSEHLALLARYVQVAASWRRFISIRLKIQAARLLNEYALPLTLENAQRLHKFLDGLRSRMVAAEVMREFNQTPASSPASPPVDSLPPADDVLKRQLADHDNTLRLLKKLYAEPELKPIVNYVIAALLRPVKAVDLVEGLHLSTARAESLARLQQAADRAGVFDPAWLKRLMEQLRTYGRVADLFGKLNERVDTIECVLRVRDGIAALPPELQHAVRRLVVDQVESEEGIRRLQRDALAGQIARQIAVNPRLNAIDRKRIQDDFARFRQLQEQKRQLVCDSILHLWRTRQKDRLLAGDGTRLSGLGADLRRRLTLRGERAMRPRQVVEIGRSTPDGDPLFDLCPVWMCSPETVAQIFPRQPIFDLVVFDEASQCRLEEALPVLLRAPRMVVAGDPRQLPPTRFFESALAASEDEELQTDQQLFELQQGEVEDLLEASLGLDMRQSYLDVHYRSLNADLIAFSNEHFYSSRLQPIPVHPSRRAKAAPVRLHRVEGVYEKRRNEAEADQVVAIVRELLGEPRAPSIGVACFNLPQRDLIVEKLEAAAADDSRFLKQLAEARNREGESSFEGLFVKNLENVQGDERDHILISTTYGPDASGKFYRRFGPLGQPGGGRRLNVLVTRAREAVHVVTSIPPAAYASLPPLESGQTPGGGWLLLAYLKFAEQVEAFYRSKGELGSGADGNGSVPLPVVETQADAEPSVTECPTRAPSSFAESLAEQLAARHRLPSDLYWGSDGFCVDVALRHPLDPQAYTLGLLCDGVRFSGGGDPIEWDIFKTAILESVGWRLHRVWSPHFFRDPRGSMKTILAAAAEPFPTAAGVPEAS